MRDQGSPEWAEHAAGVDCVVVGLLSQGRRRPWSFGRIARAVGDEVDTGDALERLRAAGFVRPLNGGFVLAAAPAVHEARSGE